jgi:signal transduction histidine kinase
MEGKVQQTRRGEMLYRRLGKTGAEVSLIGLGGSHISKPGSEREAIRLVRAAIDAGITFMDNSWDYGQGQSEIWMGKALRDGYRDRVFLMTKLDGRTKKAAARQIDESLLRLQVGSLDLAQFHELVYPHDPDLIFSEDGAAEAMRDAIQAGKVRHAGFTGHKDPFIHLRMLEMAKQLVGSREHGIEVQVRLDPEAAEVFVDRVQVQQVLLNLVRNAIEAMFDSPVRSLNISSSAGPGSFITISVEDSGSGISETIAPQLFQPFVTSKQTGMGIGLSICRTIVEAHGGRIWCEPARDHGTIFRFTLPSARADGDARNGL